MLYERIFECKSRGLIQGDAIIFGGANEVITSISDPKSKQNRSLKTRELLFVENIIEAPKINKPFTRHWKITIKSRESGEIIWMRPVYNIIDAFLIWHRLIDVNPEYLDPRSPVFLPNIYLDGDLEYAFATVVTVNATTTDNTKTWPNGGTLAPAGVSATDYLVLAGGGGGGTFGGGGGAGGYLTATNQAVTAGSSYTLTVGTKGTGATGGANARGGSGNNSVFSSFTATGGGGAGSNGTTTGVYNGANGGCGGGAGTSGGVVCTGGTGSQGGNGGNSAAGANYGAGGGGGMGAAAGATSGGTGTTTNGGNGGAGGTSSISGSSLAYGGGGGGGIFSTGTAGTGGSSIGGNGANQTTAGSAASPANRGSGGGGGGNTAAGGNGSDGVIILSYTPVVATSFNMPVLGM